ncbi:MULTISPECIES: LysR family transcriptional regulator [unclassified Sphingomonas]|uniref:LysR family transcriptional regulator n=1 Tax=unclassified Sphingomonas TaxID=196159 RepID=UPI002150AED1|nr:MULTISPECIES: LysR family transcriptional regulator [unclassified Sphingomonas]MCR5870764.1 LysR family transcriptional regulator [Sphingomonas sp. J344]UUY00901.1 LysR family transcriptional regulator [Sphingomonas sp. J315]
MRLDQFDLNLLIAFDVLIEERSVTRAAERLNLTQSAMSAALKRLRESFADEILVQHGKRMVPTAAALSLAPDVAAALLNMRAILASGMRFDPAQSQRTFRIVGSDYITTVLLGPALRMLHREAPHIRIEITLPRSDILEQLDDGEIDLLISPEQFLSPHHPRELLFEERHVVVGCSTNPVMHRRLDAETYFASGHVATSVSRDGTFIDNYLRGQGEQRRVEIVCAAFSQVPWILPGTTRLALMHERLARELAPQLGLIVQESPFPLPVMREMMQFHSARSSDRGLSWLCDRLKRAASGNAGSGETATG